MTLSTQSVLPGNALSLCLARIGLKLSSSSITATKAEENAVDIITPNPSTDLLQKLHLSFLRNICFENSEIYCGRPITSQISEVFQKIVTNRRGGVCYELNALLCFMLEKLGFKNVCMATAAIWYGGQWIDDPDPHCLPICTIVENGYERVFIADVGFGDGAASVPLECPTSGDFCDTVDKIEGCRYRVVKSSMIEAADDGYFHLHWKYGEESAELSNDCWNLLMRWKPTEVLSFDTKTYPNPIFKPGLRRCNYWGLFSKVPVRVLKGEREEIRLTSRTLTRKIYPKFMLDGVDKQSLESKIKLKSLTEYMLANFKYFGGVDDVCSLSEGIVTNENANYEKHNVLFQVYTRAMKETSET